MRHGSEVSALLIVLLVRRGPNAWCLDRDVERWEADERPEPELVRAASFRT